jgi:hypothetical protein
MLEVAELLADGPRTIEDIVSGCGISQRTAYRRLGMLRRYGYDVVARPGPNGVTVEILDVPAKLPSA